MVVSWIRSGGEPNGYDLRTPIAELNPPLPGWESTTNAPTSESSSKVSTVGTPKHMWVSSLGELRSRVAPTFDICSELIELNAE